jgi:hypothetical protein
MDAPPSADPDPTAGSSAASLPPRVALATCREFPVLDADDAGLPGLFARHGVMAVPVVWDDPNVDWNEFDLVVIRSTWDYPRKIDAFLAWVGGLPKVLNPAPVIRWNADKRYLRDLAAAGLPVVPTAYVGPGDPFTLPTSTFVIKPVVGVGSKDSARYEPGQAGEAASDVRRLHEAGMTAMIQPYLEQVERDGEVDLVFIGGRYSHSVRKGHMLGSAPREEGPLFFKEDIRPKEATLEQRDLAERVLAAVPGGADRLLYGRVDLLPTVGDGAEVSEVELIEPSLYFGHGPGSAERFVELVKLAAGADCRDR